LRKALLLRKAPATAREFSAPRTAADLWFALRLWPTAGFPLLLSVAWRLAELPGVLPRKLGRAADRDIADLPLK
jgi:hypothetical protein